MHHYHKTESLIYDYSGTERYNASYIMTDLNIGPKLNLVTGVRLKITKQNTPRTMECKRRFLTLIPWDPIQFSLNVITRYSLPSLFVKYDVTDWLSLRFAGTKTLTRPIMPISFLSIISLEEVVL